MMILCRTLRSSLRVFNVGTLDISQLLHVYKYLESCRTCMHAYNAAEHHVDI